MTPTESTRAGGIQVRENRSTTILRNRRNQPNSFLVVWVGSMGITSGRSVVRESRGKRAPSWTGSAHLTSVSFFA